MHLSKPHKKTYLPPSVYGCILLFCLSAPGAVQAETDTQQLQQAEQALAKNDLRTAKIHLRNLLKKNPSNAAARTLLGNIYFVEKNYRGASKELKIAIRLGSEDAKTLLLLARSYLKEGDVDAVIEQIKIPEGASNQFAAQILAVRAQALALNGLPEKSEAMFLEARALDPNAVEPLAGLARVELTRRNLERAIELAEQAVNAGPDDYQAWLVKAETLRTLHRFAEANEAYARTLELAPEQPTALLGRATLAIQSGDPSAARKDIDRALEIFPDSVPAHYLQALLAYQEKDYDQAAQILDKIVLRTHEHLPSQLLLGTIRYHQGQLEQAQSHLTLFVTRAPNHLNSRKLLAATQMKLRNPDKAIEVLEPALEAAPDDPQLLALLGSAYVQSGDTEKGSELLSKAAEIAPDAAAIRTQLALTKLADGQTAAAIGELEAAVDLGMSQADFLLTITYIKQKKYDKAVQAAKVLAEKLPDDPGPYNLLGAALAAKGDDEGASEAFRKALKIMPDSVSARFNLARMELRGGHRKQAIAHLDAILAEHPDHLGSATTRAGLAVQDDQREKAEALLVAAYEANPGSIKGGLVLSNFYRKIGKATDALRVAREVTSAHPENAEAERGLGMAFAATEDLHGALQSYRKVVARLPDSVEDRYRLAITQVRTGKFQDAEENLRIVLQSKPNDQQTMAVLATVHLQLEQYTAAMELASRLQKETPDAAVGYRLAGDASAAGADPKDAIDFYRQAIAKEPSTANYQRLYILQTRTNSTDAMNTAKEWLENNPKDLNPALILAANAERRKDSESALRYYQKIIEHHPDNTAALNNAAWLLKDKNYSTALAYAERAYNLNPGEVNITDTYGMVLLHQKNPEKAFILLRKAASASPNSPVFGYHLTLAQYALGRRNEAVKRLAFILQNNGAFPERTAAEQTLKKWQSTNP